MTGCCILGCSSKSENGFYMTRFPVDASKQALWLKNIQRENWKPKQYSAVCEIHFDKEMWENCREDGKKKLKRNAVPTIFLVHTKRLPEINTESLNKSKLQKFRNLEEHTTSMNINLRFGNNKSSTEDVNESISIDEKRFEAENNLCSSYVHNAELHDNNLLSSTEDTANSEALSSMSNISPCTMEHALKTIKLLEQKVENKNREVNEMKQKLQNSSKIIRKYNKSNKTLMNCIKKLRNSERRVENTLLQSTKLLHEVFNPDQIEWLKSSKRHVQNWSKETIKKALRIKFSCTNSGYKELINQNIPLPSTRTLRRSLEGITFNPGILDDIFDAMKDKVQQFGDERERDCMLGIDEMSLTPGEQTDPSTNSIVGSSTIPNSSEENFVKNTMVLSTTNNLFLICALVIIIANI